MFSKRDFYTFICYISKTLSELLQKNTNLDIIIDKLFDDGIYESKEILDILQTIKSLY